MSDTDHDKARGLRGFGEAVSKLGDWFEDGPVLRLPPEGESGASAFLPPLASFFPQEPPATVFVEGWSERLGNLEARLAELAALLAEGALLVLDLRHVMGPSALRESFEGRRSGLDARPAQAEREISFDVLRVAAALARAGFVVEDLIHAPAWDPAWPKDALLPLIDLGFAATEQLYRRPGERLWVRARRTRPVSGSVLLAGGGAAAGRTRAALESFLPRGWEIVAARGEPEARAWNRAFTRARGGLLWLLRAGDEPDRAAFVALRQAAGPFPAAPADPDGELRHGLGGLLCPRESFLRIGPLPEDCPSPRVAGEEWFLRASACGLPVTEAALERPWRGPEPPPAACDADEARRLFARWDGVGELPNPGEAYVKDIPPPPWEREGRAPRISLCMIARNEERYLEGCLARVKDAVDEIVLVDTGSTDRTVEIARSFGARVLERPWDDDFSAPRNLALRHASGDWILVLDADEYVCEESLPLLREMAANPRAWGFQLHFVNDFEDGRTRGVMMVRMFRNLPGIHYVYRIHEQVVPSLVAAAEPLGLALHPSDVKVLHYGYSDGVMKERGKTERNLRLFALQLEDDPEDVYCLYKYADFLRQIGRPADEVIEVFERAYALALDAPPEACRRMPFAGEIAALLGLEHAKQGRVELADRILRRGLKRFMPTPNLHYVAAGVACSLGRFAEALDHYERLTAYRDQVLVVPVQEGITDWIAWTGMASCHLGLGDVDRAAELLELARAAAPDQETPLLVLSGLELRRGEPGRAMQLLTDFIVAQRDSGPVRFQGGLILERLGRSLDAGEWLRRALELGGVDERQVRAALDRVRPVSPAFQPEPPVRSRFTHKDELFRTAVRT